MNFQDCNPKRKKKWKLGYTVNVQVPTVSFFGGNACHPLIGDRFVYSTKSSRKFLLPYFAASLSSLSVPSETTHLLGEYNGDIVVSKTDQVLLSTYADPNGAFRFPISPDPS